MVLLAGLVDWGSHSENYELICDYRGGWIKLMVKSKRPLVKLKKEFRIGGRSSSNLCPMFVGGFAAVDLLLISTSRELLFESCCKMGVVYIYVNVEMMNSGV